MFKKQILLSSLFLLVTGAFILLPLFRLSKEEKVAFEKLNRISAKKKNEKGELSYTESVRQQVVKEIWFREKEALHMKICSGESALFFFNEGKTIEVVEQLGDVECFMQEKLFYILPGGKEVAKKMNQGEPMQEVRYMKAKKACYNYNSQLFVAEDVFLSKYRIPGHTLPKSLVGLPPLMQGTADNVEFTLKGEKINFKAGHFRATFDSKKGLM